MWLRGWGYISVGMRRRGQDVASPDDALILICLSFAIHRPDPDLPYPAGLRTFVHRSSSPLAACSLSAHAAEPFPRRSVSSSLRLLRVLRCQGRTRTPLVYYSALRARCGSRVYTYHATIENLPYSFRHSMSPGVVATLWRHRSPPTLIRLRPSCDAQSFSPRLSQPSAPQRQWAMRDLSLPRYIWEPTNVHPVHFVKHLWQYARPAVAIQRTSSSSVV